jgi:hypothetical protein
LILLNNKEVFINLFNQELQILLDYESELEKLKQVCTINNIIPSMVLIYCVRFEDYNQCKQNYNKTIDYIKYLSDNYINNIFANLKSEIIKLETTQNFFNPYTKQKKIPYLDIYRPVFDDINNYKNDPNYTLNTVEGIQIFVNY